MEKEAILMDILVILSISFIVQHIYTELYNVPEVPQMKNTWWGTGADAVDDIRIKPFRIQVSQQEIRDLHKRLNLSRIKSFPLFDIGPHKYGISSNLIKHYAQYWVTKYNWSEREEFLNQYSQYKTQIQGLHIHFIQVKPKTTTTHQVIPLLLLHGWPGSVREFYEVIPILTTPQKNRNFVFEVVVPSLPGFGFSDAPTVPGCGVAEMAVIFNNLMKRLGYNSYYVHGGDWGAGIASSMSILYPSQISGLHLNLCVAQTKIAKLKTIWEYMKIWLDSSTARQLKMYPLYEQFESMIMEAGHFYMQPANPDTIGIGLTDSPIGLAAYILEKFMILTNPEGKYQVDGGLVGTFSEEKLLDNIMIYWLSRSITTAMRIYTESTSEAEMALGLTQIPISVPSACAKFPHELIIQPDNILNSSFLNLVHSKEYSRGGHFAAFEEPILLAEDILEAVTAMRGNNYAINMLA